MCRTGLTSTLTRERDRFHFVHRFFMFILKTFKVFFPTSFSSTLGLGQPRKPLGLDTYMVACRGIKVLAYNVGVMIAISLYFLM